MTTGRRSSPVPQLSCVGGSGSGRGLEPAVVQCYNRGWDGREVQWECKTDMEGAARFGRVEVVCEGYDYAEDDFILAGSCGLEYTLELTKEGRQQNSGGGGGWFSGQQSSGYSYNSNYGYDASKSTSGFGDLIVIVVVGILIYAFYKTCIDTNSLQDTQYSSTDGDYPGGGGGAGGWADPNRGSNNYQGGGNFYGGRNDTCGGARQRGTGAGGGGGGFWTGAATGPTSNICLAISLIFYPQEDCWDTCSVTGALDMEATTAATEATIEAGAGEAAATTAAGVAAEAPGPGAERPRHHRQERGQLRASAAPGGDKYY